MREISKKCTNSTRLASKPGFVRITVGILLAGMAITSARAGAIVYSDSTFNLGDYSIQSYQSSPGILVSVTQTTSGHPGTAVEATMISTDPNFSLVVGLLNQNFNYNATANGPLAAIDVSLDRYLLPLGDGVDLGFNPFTLRTFIEQGGQLFQAIESFPGFPAGQSDQWSTLSANNLTAADFGLYDFSTNSLNSAINPDFSQSIDAFGLGMRTSGPGSGGQFLSTLKADNWALKLHTVPEPDSLALAGLGALALALTRRPKAGARLRLDRASRVRVRV